jgi:hypothetical protein
LRTNPRSGSRATVTGRFRLTNFSCIVGRATDVKCMAQPARMPGKRRIALCEVAGRAGPLVSFGIMDSNKIC